MLHDESRETTEPAAAHFPTNHNAATVQRPIIIVNPAANNELYGFVPHVALPNVSNGSPTLQEGTLLFDVSSAGSFEQTTAQQSSSSVSHGLPSDSCLETVELGYGASELCQAAAAIGARHFSSASCYPTVASYTTPRQVSVNAAVTPSNFLAQAYQQQRNKYRYPNASGDVAAVVESPLQNGRLSQQPFWPFQQNLILQRLFHQPQYASMGEGYGSQRSRALSSGLESSGALQFSPYAAATPVSGHSWEQPEPVSAPYLPSYAAYDFAPSETTTSAPTPLPFTPSPAALWQRLDNETTAYASQPLPMTTLPVTSTHTTTASVDSITYGHSPFERFAPEFANQTSSRPSCPVRNEPVTSPVAPVRAPVVGPRRPEREAQPQAAGNNNKGGRETNKRKRIEMSESNCTRSTVLRNAAGGIEGYAKTFGGQKITRGPLSDEQRENKSRARKVGSCERCRTLKIACDRHDKSPYEECTSCMAYKKRYKGKIKLPCLVAKIRDAIFFRPGPCANSPLETRREAVYTLKDFSHASVRKRVTLSQDGGRTCIQVHASDFMYHAGDKVSYEWKDSTGTHHLHMPAYCLTNLRDIQLALNVYLQRKRNDYDFMLQKSNLLTRTTIFTALNFAHSKKSSLVLQALDMWAACRVIEDSWQLSVRNPLGIQMVDDERSPWNRMIPITPVMDTQLDQIVIQTILNPLRKEIVETLEGLIDQHKPETWFETYLTTFILLSSIERCFAHSKRFAQRYGLSNQYADPKMVDAWKHTSNLLLAHFHFVCNGSAPLRVDWNDRASATFAQLDEDQVNFMKKTQELASREVHIMEQLRSDRLYHEDMFWTHQLLLRDWRCS